MGGPDGIQADWFFILQEITKYRSDARVTDERKFAEGILMVDDKQERTPFSSY